MFHTIIFFKFEQLTFFNDFVEQLLFEQLHILVSSSFFEQMNFEQMTLLHKKFGFNNVIFINFFQNCL